MSTAAIVIPVYKELPDENEKKSLEQALKILASHPVVFACPDNLATEFYSKSCGDMRIVNFNFAKFKPEYFQSVSGYNRLLLSEEFYSKFEEYQYILLYQLDAYVFKDELNTWCDKDFSYIGAPWFTGQDKSTPESGFMEFAGNGGFSLRKVADFLKVIRTKKIMKSQAEIFAEHWKMGMVAFFLRLPLLFLKMFGFRNNATYERNKFSANEDHYWAFNAKDGFSGFRAAKAEDAIGFAFECQPRRMFTLNKNQLPFGCHAWLKYDYDFWKPYLA